MEMMSKRDRTHLLVYPPIPTHIMLNVIMKECKKSLEDIKLFN